MSAHTPTIVERLEKLENENFRLKGFVLLLTILVCSIFTIGLISQKSQTLEAENFLLRDKMGRVRGALFINDETGGVGLTFLNLNSKERLTMGIERPAGKSFLRFVNDDGKAPLTLVNDKKGTGIIFLDQRGNSRASLGEFNKAYSLNFLDANKKERLQLSVNQSGEPSFILKDSNEKARVLLGVTGYYGEPILSLLTANGRPLFYKP